MRVVVEISLQVIDRFNLTRDEINQLIKKLQSDISTNQSTPEAMNNDEVYALEFEQWMLKNSLYKND